jgi:hypothetical protein
MDITSATEYWTDVMLNIQAYNRGQDLIVFYHKKDLPQELYKAKWVNDNLNKYGMCLAYDL